MFANVYLTVVINHGNHTSTSHSHFRFTLFGNESILDSDHLTESCFYIPKSNSDLADKSFNMAVHSAN